MYESVNANRDKNKLTPFSFKDVLVYKNIWTVYKWIWFKDLIVEMGLYC